MSVADLRQEYMARGLLESEVDSDPITQFERWFKEALAAGILEPNAMTLSTVDAEGRPHGRIVLLKGFDPAGFVFFTNYESQKGQHLAHNPHAALTFLWLPLERQVCITGSVEKVPRADTEAYFRTRPHGSQLGAWASHQSRVIAGRHVLEHQLAEVTRTFGNGDIPAPPH